MSRTQPSEGGLVCAGSVAGGDLLMERIGKGEACTLTDSPGERDLMRAEGSWPSRETSAGAREFGLIWGRIREGHSSEERGHDLEGYVAGAGEDEGAEGEAPGTDRGEEEGPEGGVHDGAAGGEGVRGGAGGGGDDEAVGLGRVSGGGAGGAGTHEGLGEVDAVDVRVDAVQVGAAAAVEGELVHRVGAWRG